jgi:hypothetical protein
MCVCEWLATYIHEKGILKNGPLVTNSYYLIIVKPLYNHAHFSHILVCVTFFLVTIFFSKKHHFL